MNNDYIYDLNNKGYCIIPNILNPNEIFTAKELFYDWYNSVPNIDYLHNKLNPHNIFKFHEVAHQEFAWYLRTKPQIIKTFAELYNTDTNNLVTSFDGSCYYKPNTKLSDGLWTHTDISPKLSQEIKCYQGFISLTDNIDNSLQVYEESHKMHENYFRSKNQENEKKNWLKIDKDYLDNIEDKRNILNVPAGSLVLWDSRTFHQNIIKNKNEERIVQYICMMPKDNNKNTPSMQKKRLKYFQDRRTTSHWCYPIKVNGLQGRTYGNNDLVINYDELPKPNLDKYMNVIKTLI
tara:strand:+ start:96 stop:971 length:876 start_codon:yes stop_codon:yes gene_type:complete